MDNGVVYNLATVSKWLESYRLHHTRTQILYGKPDARYLSEYGGNMKYNDGKMLVDIWDALLDYSKAYFVYITLNFMLTNYSVRQDHIIEDIGNLPRVDVDFFDRDAAEVGGS